MASGKPPDHLNFVPGDKIAGQFQITSFIGAGGTAALYLARDTLAEAKSILQAEPDKSPQYRTLKFPLEQRQDLIDGITREVQVGNKVRHPNICKTFTTGKHKTGRVDPATGRDEEIEFGVMEYIGGENLFDVINRRQGCKTEDGIRWAIELCTGVGAFHDAGIVHCDLKPENLMIDGTGSLKIIDHGMATFIGTYSGGTRNFMAPERFNGPARPPADMYAVGATLYQLFTGRLCLPGDSTSEVRKSQKTLEQRRPLTLGVDRSIDHAIMKALHHDAEARLDAKSLHSEWVIVAQSFTP